MKNSFKEAALEYHRKGFSVIPLRSMQKIPLIEDWSKYCVTRSTEEEINKWWDQHLDANIGIACGPANGINLFVVDQDIFKDQDKNPILNEDGSFQMGDITGCPPTVSQTTGSGGKQFFYRAPEGYEVRNGTPRPHVDVRGVGGQVVVPPSIHPSGGTYEWNFEELALENISEFPKEALDKFLSPIQKPRQSIRELLEKGVPVGQGLRHEAIKRITGHHLSFVSTPTQLERARRSVYKWDQEVVKSPEPAEDRQKEIDAIFDGLFERELEQRGGSASVNFGKKKETQAVRLMKLVEENKVLFFHNQTRMPYMRIWLNGHYEIKSCSADSLKHWLHQIYWKEYGETINSDAVNTALMIMKARACNDGDMKELYNRIAFVDDVIWYDLADKNWRVIKITKDGWDLVNEPPVLFRREGHQDEQIVPERGGDINSVLDFVNIQDEDQKILFLVYLVSCFIPGFPHPIPYVYGEQGAAKTTLSRIIKMFADPSQLDPTGLSRTEEALAQVLSHHWVSVFDNVSYIPYDVSDALCRAVTGGGFSKRTLYTDDEDYIYKFRRCIVLNGINLLELKPDLMERSMLFSLKRVPEEKKRQEKEFYEKLNKEKPKILGAIFTAVSDSLRLKPDLLLPKKLPRMADFASWGCVIAVALGYNQEEFMDAYYRNIKKQNSEILGESIIAGAVISLVEEKITWAGTSSELLAEIKERAGDGIIKEAGFPKSASTLSRSLGVLKTNLAEGGISFNKTLEKNRVLIHLELIGGPENDQPHDDKDKEFHDY